MFPWKMARIGVIGAHMHMSYRTFPQKSSKFHMMMMPKMFHFFWFNQLCKACHSLIELDDVMNKSDICTIAPRLYTESLVILTQNEQCFHWMSEQLTSDSLYIKFHCEIHNFSCCDFRTWN